jgi:phospholipid/cholesterol/gamma-HCH transport system ATP-binding protein
MSETSTLAGAEARATSGAAIEFKNITKKFGEKIVVEDLNLQIPRGQTTVLLGPSGTGKSTLLRIATGLMRPDSGSVVVLGEDVLSLARGGLLKLRRRIGMLFQENALFGSLTVEENVAFPLRRVGKVAHKEAIERAANLLDVVGLPGVGKRLPDALSGGQKKRVALARALALEPELVLFDEPTSGLDPQTSAAIDALIRETQERLGATFVVITHDTTSAAEIAHHVGFLYEGRLRAWGTRQAVWSSEDPAVRAFLDRQVPAR